MSTRTCAARVWTRALRVCRPRLWSAYLVFVLLARGPARVDLALGILPRVSAEDRVYQRKDRDGRLIYTNIGNVSVDQSPLEPLELKDLARLDLSSLPASSLVSLDARIEQEHAELRQGQRCAQIRAASGVPEWIWLLREQRRELLMALGLLVLALVAKWASHGRVMRILLPLLPFSGAIFLGYTALRHSQFATDDLRTALGACSEELPELGVVEARGSAREQKVDTDSLRQKLHKALDLKASIDKVFDERQRRMEASLQSQKH